MDSLLLCDPGFSPTTTNAAPAQGILPEALQSSAKPAHLPCGYQGVEPFLFWAEISLILFERQNSRDHNSA